MTPRRSQRIHKTREASPALEESLNITRGPRSIAKLMKSQRDLNKTATGVEKETPKVTITRPSLPSQDKTKRDEEKEDVSIEFIINGRFFQ